MNRFAVVSIDCATLVDAAGNPAIVRRALQRPPVSC